MREGLGGGGMGIHFNFKLTDSLFVTLNSEMFFLTFEIFSRHLRDSLLLQILSRWLILRIKFEMIIDNLSHMFRSICLHKLSTSLRIVQMVNHIEYLVILESRICSLYLRLTSLNITNVTS